MRVAALADVHGNAVALEAALAELEREQPDLIVSCGDLTWGPLPLETVTLLEPWRERVLCVRGNSERELVERQLLDSEIAVWEHEQHDGAALSEYLARTQATGSSWSGGTWNGSSWSGSSWSGSSWSGGSWADASWS